MRMIVERVMKEERSLTWEGLKSVLTFMASPRTESKAAQKKILISKSWEVSEQLTRLF